MGFQQYFTWVHYGGYVLLLRSIPMSFIGQFIKNVVVGMVQLYIEAKSKKGINVLLNFSESPKVEMVSDEYAITH